MATVDHAVQVTKGAAQGYEDFLRIGICDVSARQTHLLPAP